MLDEKELLKIKEEYPEHDGVTGNVKQITNEVGNKYGKLTVLYRGMPNPNVITPRVRWVCLCECGGIKIVEARRLRSGETKTCGKCRKTEFSAGTEFYKQQRSKMTPNLREQIKKRDNYTCQKCGLSIYDEPHLLLEVDHLIPISKGGLSEESNLITLCWMCNRAKSDK